MTATRYQAASKRGKGVILDELCANTGWHRSHARKGLEAALAPTVVTMRSARPVKYGPEVIRCADDLLDGTGHARRQTARADAHRAGGCAAPLRKLIISDETAALLVSMSAATIDRRLADERARCKIKGRVGTKPGSLIRSQIPMRTWAQWDDAVPGLVEIDMAFHDGGRVASPEKRANLRWMGLA